MILHLSPRSLSKQLYSLSFVAQERCQRFIHLHILSWTTSCSLSFDLSHPDQKCMNPKLQKDTIWKILDRYERDQRERWAGGSKGERVDRIRAYLGSMTMSALQSSVAGWKIRSKLQKAGQRRSNKIYIHCKKKEVCVEKWTQTEGLLAQLLQHMLFVTFGLWCSTVIQWNSNLTRYLRWIE